MSERPLAYSYVRFSTPEQAKGESYRRQIASAREYAEKNNLNLDESLRDEGVSAFRGKHRNERAALGAFLKRVEKGDVPHGSYLLIESLDRLSREEVVDALELFLSLTRNGIVIVTLIDKRAYSRESLRADHTQLIISIVVMSRAYEESATKSDRVSKAWAAKRRLAAEEKQAMTARCPAWIQLIGGPKSGHYALIPERAEIVLSIFDQTIRGLGRRTIASRLNDAKVETWGAGKKKGQFWHDSYISKILSNPATFGRYVPKGKLAGGSDFTAEAKIDGYFPAIIEEEIYWAAQTESKARGFAKGTSGQRKNLLSGLVRCEACSSNMVLINKTGRSKLRCGRAHASAGCDHRVLYDYGPIETGVIFGLGSKRKALIDAANDQQTQALDALKAGQLRRDAIQDRLDNLIKLVEEAGGSERVAKRVEILEGELHQADTELPRLERALLQADPSLVKRASDNLQEDFNAISSARGSPDARAALHQRLKRLIDHVVLGPNGCVAMHSDGSSSRVYFSKAAAKP